MGFNGAKDDAFLGILHGIVEEDKVKELVLGGIKSLLVVDAEDTKVNPLHMIFHLKKVLGGKEYFCVKSYEYVPKEDNYLMKIIFLYLKFFHNFGFSVSTFVEFYPFNTIRSIKDDNVGF